MTKLLAIIILVIIILIALFFRAKAVEGYDNPNYSIFSEYGAHSDTADLAKIKLYEDYSFDKLAYDYTGQPGMAYVKKIIKINLKSADLSLPRLGNGYDAVRRIEIWGMNQGDNLASEAANFYNSYLEPENELRGNPAKYQQLIQILPGDNVRLQIVEPVKQIMLIALV